MVDTGVDICYGLRIIDEKRRKPMDDESTGYLVGLTPAECLS